MKRLIVNADDFGLTSGVNRAVIEGHERGIITSATLMANVPAFAEAAQLARERPGLGIGLHFNITEGHPIAPAAQVHSLTDGRSEFLGTVAAVAWRSLAGRLRTEEIVLELRAQIEKALASGLHLTHVDSHKHIHAVPQVFEAVVSTIPEYGIRAVRLPREPRRWNSAPSSLKLIKQTAATWGLAQLCRANLARLRDRRLRTADAFFGVARTGLWTKQWLIDVIEHLPEGVSELMCHPGYDDDKLYHVETRLHASRAEELRLLTDPDVAALLRVRAVQLINYSSIDRNG